MVWSPASKDTTTSTGDRNNAAVRRPEFAKWVATDVPLMAGMNVNTVRLFLDPGFDAALGPSGLQVLDQLYARGIMVIMTVDDAINDTSRVTAAVNFYKDHPAVLMWMLGNEWNINKYYGVATSVADAAQRTQSAAALIKSLDSIHPVSSSYGDIDIDGDGLRLADTQHYVNDVAPSVDLRVRTLSGREREILSLLANGWSNRRIAEECFLSLNTVRTHVQNVLVKLGVHSKLEAVAFALEHQVVTAGTGAPGWTGNA